MKRSFLHQIIDRSFVFMHLFMSMLFLMLSIYIVLNNPGRRTAIVMWCILYLAGAIGRHVFFTRGSTWRRILPLIEVVATQGVIASDVSGFGLSLIPILAIDLVHDLDLPDSAYFGALIYLQYMWNYIGRLPSISLIQWILLFVIGALQFTLFIGFGFLAKRYSVQRTQLEQTTAELHARMITMEQMTVLKERNRIAGEIHNTVGHKLTTALVQIEATQMLLARDPEEVSKRLGIIRAQVRDGLAELRKSIQAINADEDYDNLEETVFRLVSQVEDHTGVQVDVTIDSLTKVRRSVKRMLYHIILESTTNAIRHGRCSRIAIDLTSSSECLTLQVFNNGAIPDDLVYGFGLSHIQADLTEAGGSFVLKLNDVGWFGLVATLPAAY